MWITSFRCEKMWFWANKKCKPIWSPFLFSKATILGTVDVPGQASFESHLAYSFSWALALFDVSLFPSFDVSSIFWFRSAAQSYSFLQRLTQSKWLTGCESQRFTDRLSVTVHDLSSIEIHWLKAYSLFINNFLEIVKLIWNICSALFVVFQVCFKLISIVFDIWKLWKSNSAQSVNSNCNICSSIVWNKLFQYFETHEIFVKILYELETLVSSPLFSN